MSGYDNASPYGARSGSYDDDGGGARGGGLTLSPPAVVSMHLSVYPTPVRYVRFDKVHLPRLLPLMLEVLFYRGSKASGATAGGGEASAHASARCVCGAVVRSCDRAVCRCAALTLAVRACACAQ